MPRMTKERLFNLIETFGLAVAGARNHMRARHQKEAEEARAFDPLYDTQWARGERLRYRDGLFTPEERRKLDKDCGYLIAYNLQELQRELAMRQVTVYEATNRLQEIAHVAKGWLTTPAWETQIQRIWDGNSP